MRDTFSYDQFDEFFTDIRGNALLKANVQRKGFTAVQSLVIAFDNGWVNAAFNQLNTQDIQ